MRADSCLNTGGDPANNPYIMLHFDDTPFFTIVIIMFSPWLVLHSLFLILRVALFPYLYEGVCINNYRI